MIVINPIPGQEEQNAEFLEKKNVGIWLKKNDNIKEVLEEVINSNVKLEEMKRNVKGLANKKSTEQICKIIINNYI